MIHGLFTSIVVSGSIEVTWNPSARPWRLRMECYGSSIALSCETCPRSWSPWELGGHHGSWKPQRNKAWLQRLPSKSLKVRISIRLSIIAAALDRLLCLVLLTCFCSLTYSGGMCTCIWWYSMFTFCGNIWKSFVKTSSFDITCDLRFPNLDMFIHASHELIVPNGNAEKNDAPSPQFGLFVIFTPHGSCSTVY